jgi:hypothetical protein
MTTHDTAVWTSPIPVSERLPDINWHSGSSDWVLAFPAELGHWVTAKLGAYGKAGFAPDDYWLTWHFQAVKYRTMVTVESYTQWTVTHWMPLPPVPAARASN